MDKREQYIDLLDNYIDVLRYECHPKYTETELDDIRNKLLAEYDNAV